MSAAGRPFELPPRREQVTITWREAIGGHEQELSMSFGFALDGRLREIFCNAYKAGSHRRAEQMDACIALSHLLQRGATIYELAAAFGEDRAEGAASGPPSSTLGAITRKACELIAGRPYICDRRGDICTRMRGAAACDCETTGAVR